MDKYLWLIPALPLGGFLILALAGKRLSRSSVAIVGAGSICLSALITFVIGGVFLAGMPPNAVYTQTLWTWFEVGAFSAKITLSLDVLSLVFVFVITFIGALIHIYSTAFMEADRDYARFFASMNLFVFSMLVLVLADNLLLMYLGWEGVGLCSYLLIGFWYEQQANGNAARKAFTVTRIGDAAMAIGLFMIFQQAGTLVISDIGASAGAIWQPNSTVVTVTALLLLAGGVGKSAQLPLQTWLPDAMAGPSPVSALIHAATMVTAGVYLVARMHAIFALSETARLVITVIGAATLLLAGLTALTQYDIKRVLAYSTISQIGYMFLALGVGAWTAAIFHFMVHAFFKALLFLAAGAIIESLHHEHNMFKMGGLKDKMPVVFWTFLVGALSLAAVPLISAGFYSKDQILWYSWTANGGSPVLWMVALSGALITAAYTTRMMILTFWGEAHTPVGHLPGRRMTMPLVVLAVFSVFAGFIELPHNFGHFTLFSDLLRPVLPETVMRADIPSEWLFQLLAALATLGGVFLGYHYYYQQPSRVESLRRNAMLAGLHRFWFSGWGFEALYDRVLVKPFIFISKINKSDVTDRLYTGIAAATGEMYKLLSRTQSGSLRWYIMGLVVGAILILGIQIML
ncbi:NADH-quinone oxidoreductase subunit L [Dyadobacter sp. BE34]|uniref:NADH-quinone oxidoreductase subunit L n=1 Tax=Dyadobacter fermentans TaxID=94254 RepID=A0ABU1R019_9BACT|nr:MULTISPECIES: NADH-quinone oxidoreductase subunit L [Dyadobacter]MDR6806757.1 NADH-quinone oxidoreductase subunit L [Dyadobacter fermentans]MDR7044499.1 NADH-quinone oxidoreductase subunit L [Dyadobacter sp. BE242]MDR7198809.1 NADH-quinone oxidoreductase subunit L [Dyadobacter sp. BE34]MDR7216771.1 NADH-quinone oxidoreductase subunit L [Dyadobacter sp. BE31]MDR7263703.1 NADH-quinone oxidoreductase subunit L [Dyadobacter sp. BE32]